MEEEEGTGVAFFGDSDLHNDGKPARNAVKKGFRFNKVMLKVAFRSRIAHKDWMKLSFDIFIATQSACIRILLEAGEMLR